MKRAALKVDTMAETRTVGGNVIELPKKDRS
jgi:hypothetical protein